MAESFLFLSIWVCLFCVCFLFCVIYLVYWEKIFCSPLQWAPAAMATTTGCWNLRRLPREHMVISEKVISHQGDVDLAGLFIVGTICSPSVETWLARAAAVPLNQSHLLAMPDTHPLNSKQNIYRYQSNIWYIIYVKLMYSEYILSYEQLFLAHSPSKAPCLLSWQRTVIQHVLVF